MIGKDMIENDEIGNDMIEKDMIENDNNLKWLSAYAPIVRFFVFL